VVVSLDPAGKLDPAFAGDGAADLESASLTGVALDAQGRILATGSLSATPSVRALLARFLPNGSLDQTFGTAGRASAGFGRIPTVGRAVAIAPDGRIVITTNRITGFRSDHLVMGLMRFVVTDGPRDPDGDGVLGKRDRCPDLGGKARNHGCPLIKRQLELEVRGLAVKGTLDAPRQCSGIDRAAIFEVQPGRDDLLARAAVGRRGGFHLGLGAQFEGRVYAKLRAHINPIAGLCGAARSNKVSVG
jgi:hypothetical protein